MENCKCQGKVREKSGNFEVDDKWQPCTVHIAKYIYILFFSELFLHKSWVLKTL